MTKIIDFRLRPNIAEYTNYFANPASHKFMSKVMAEVPPTQSLEQVIENVQRAGISRFVFTGRDRRSGGGWFIENEVIAQCQAKYPDIIVGFAGVDLGGADPVRQVEHAVELGLRGLSLDVQSTNRTPDDPHLFPVYETAQKHSLPIFFTMGPYPGSGALMELGSPLKIDALAKAFPKLTIICSHAGWPFVTEMMGVAMRHDNVYVDNSVYYHFPGMEAWTAAYNGILRDKVLFASGFPFRDYRHAVEYFKNLSLTEEARNRIFYQNAERILGAI